jgi:hypothetical protein
MTDQRRNDRGRGRPPFSVQPPQQRDEPPRDPGAYIGRKPERATSTIPGGVGRRDDRVAATPTQPAPVRGTTTADSPATPEGHSEGPNATDAQVREAGQNP